MGAAGHFFFSIRGAEQYTGSNLYTEGFDPMRKLPIDFQKHAPQFTTRDGFLVNPFTDDLTFYHLTSADNCYLSGGTTTYLTLSLEHLVERAYAICNIGSWEDVRICEFQISGVDPSLIFNWKACYDKDDELTDLGKAIEGALEDAGSKWEIPLTYYYDKYEDKAASALKTIGLCGWVESEDYDADDDPLESEEYDADDDPLGNLYLMSLALFTGPQKGQAKLHLKATNVYTPEEAFEIFSVCDYELSFKYREEHEPMINLHKSLKPNPSETTYVLPMGPEGLRLIKPMQLFHATVNSSAVLESGGLRSRSELGGLNMTGGGPDESISMTGDIRVAEAVVLALVTTCRIAQDEITASELLDAFRRISPGGHSNFVSQKNVYKDIKNTKFKGYDLFNLYRDILMFGHVFDQTIYDPVLVSTDLSFFDAPSEDLINNICVLSCDLSTRARIVPRNHRFRQLPGQLNYVQFPVDEHNIKTGRTSSSWGDFRYKDGVSEYLFRGAHGHSLAVEIVHEPITGPVRTNVSYLEQMDEYRVWDSSLLSNYAENECGPDILERIQDRTGQDVFYPYFKELTIEDNLIRSQAF